ncbi:MAG: prolipoprotein diacylglyceryl transferase [Prochlorococcus sp. SP3034]|nr:prolipoprotein diacylglyceryl transferase [Prochlorococcus sp. SP3034]|tara:strand:+ start:378 stop:1256 length:879 start_codon:yes stop_codon:yes gene_type:complete
MDSYLAYIKSPGSELLNIGFLTIKWYGFLISISVLLGLNISRKLASARRIDPQYISNLLPSLVISSVFGARIYYVIFELRQYSGNNFFTFIYPFNIPLKFPSFLAIWEGGIAIHGALIGGFISIVIFCRTNKINLKAFLDVIMPSVILGQAIGRWGNFFNNEAFGIPTDLPWKLYVPVRYRPIEFINSEFFHPTFLYESLWNLIIFIILIYFFKQQNKVNIIKDGLITCLYLITYSMGRFWIESLRTDPLCVGALPPFCEGGLRVAQFISIFIFSAGLIWLYFLNFKLRERN